LDTCACGTALRHFWVWRDSNQVLHASSFSPSSGALHEMIAATARDALLPMTGGRAPKHDVRMASDPDRCWPGRCSLGIIAQAAL